MKPSIDGVNTMEHMQELEAIVREAGKIMGAAELTEAGIYRKPGDANFVTAYDVQIQRFLIEQISSLFPDAGFFGEEDTAGNEKQLTQGYTFIIDPIDGTTNFMFNYHHSCVSVGVALNGTLEAGLIYDPYTDSLYTAVRGQGAYLNGRHLVLADTPVSQGIACFGCARYNEADYDRLFDVVKELFLESLSIRSVGSAALGIARIASGSNVCYLELKLQPYDYAAAAVILEEAGGCIVQPDGSPITLDKPCSVVAGTPKAVEHILTKF